jgi:plastocyanin
MFRRLIVPSTGLMLSLLIAITGCGGGDGNQKENTQSSVFVEPTADTKTIEIRTTTFPYTFDPAVTRIPPGKAATLKFVVDDGLLPLADGGKPEDFHTFTSDQLGIDIKLLPKSVSSHTIRIDAKGSYDFYCRTHHKKLGMTGVLSVR